MHTGVQKWIVEETDRTGTVVYAQEFSDYEEALGVYNDLKENNDDSINVSIHKTDRKLLQE